jgi:hypothetical protein
MKLHLIRAVSKDHMFVYGSNASSSYPGIQTACLKITHFFNKTKRFAVFLLYKKTQYLKISINFSIINAFRKIMKSLAHSLLNYETRNETDPIIRSGEK